MEKVNKKGVEEKRWRKNWEDIVEKKWSKKWSYSNVKSDKEDFSRASEQNSLFSVEKKRGVLC